MAAVDWLFNNTKPTDRFQSIQQFSIIASRDEKIIEKILII